MLNDHSPGVVGAAAAAFASICPNNLPLIGRHYQRLCEILPDVEEWGQIILIGILLRYVIARHGLVEESIMRSLHCKEHCQSEKNGLQSDAEFILAEDNSEIGLNYKSELLHMISQCYVEGPDEYLSRSSLLSKGSSESKLEYFQSAEQNEDVKILLQCTSPLFWSNNSAVVLAAAGVHWIMAPMKDVKRIVKPLLFLLRSANTSQYVVLEHFLNLQFSKLIVMCLHVFISYVCISS